MGLFLNLTGIANVSGLEVERALQAYALSKNGKLVPVDPQFNDPYAIVITESPYGHVSVLFPRDFLLHEEISAYLSQALYQPVFAFHIHDGHLWMYNFYVNGEEVDQFDPLPQLGHATGYERLGQRGSAQIICQHWPRLKVADITNYLVFWKTEDMPDHRPKAYPDDMYSMGDSWQLFDFTDKLGLLCPVDNSETLLGYRYHLAFDGAYHDYKPLLPKKPWWKFWG